MKSCSFPAFFLQAELKKQLSVLQSDKGDFGEYLSLERQKHKDREAELTEQLEQAYLENSQLRSKVDGRAEGREVIGQSEAVTPLAVVNLQGKLDELEAELERYALD